MTSYPLPRITRAALVALVVAAGALRAPPLEAQDDVTWLGARYGTVPPESYYRLRSADPEAFRFSRGWINRNPRLRLERAEVANPGLRLRTDAVAPPLARSPVGPQPVLGRREGAVEGSFVFPVILGYFADDVTGPAFDQEAVQRHFFDGPNDRGGTIRDFYAEMSAGAVDLQGETNPWVRSSLTREEVTAGVSGLGGASRVGDFIVATLTALDTGGIDWGRYDNDGPDGIPNSGDDDGFVDILAVVHSTAGAECNRAPDRIWSHRWSLWGLVGAPYETSTLAAGGGMIRVNDYTIQPLLDCSESGLNDIGVMAHELGHGFGLPDLYCTRNACTAAGIGEWGLMGSGAWGCDGDDPAYPCHMSAWSKAMLGWVTVEDIPDDAPLQEVTLEPVVGGSRVLRYGIPGTREYFLLENRQARGFDRNVHAPGLIVWHVDQDGVEAGWPVNRVNADPDRYGVAVVQADAFFQLESSGGNRGDAGDPFPGSLGRMAFHAGSVPASVSHDGVVSGLTLLELGQRGEDLVFQLSTRFQSIAFRTEGDAGLTSLLEVDGSPLAAGGEVIPGAPFQRLQVRAAPGEVLDSGVRTPFVSWDDGVTTTERVLRVEFLDTTWTATYAGRQVQVDMTLEGGQFGVEPGFVSAEPPSPGLWFEEGTAVTLTAHATTGFGFQHWTGALEGAPNPVGLVVDGPVTAGAVFGFEFAVEEPQPLAVAAGDAVSLTLAVENASPPVRWFLEGGRLPAGLRVLESGMVSGTPAEPGVYDFTVRARDGLGLEGAVPVTLTVGVPELPLSVLGGTLLENGTEPTFGQVLYLDLMGNRNGRVDTGDIRAHLLRAADGTVPPAPALVERHLILRRIGSGGPS